MKVRECDPALHVGQMLAIVNETIANTTWVYDYAPRAEEDIVEYVRTRLGEGFPVIVAEGDDDQLLGFGTFGSYRSLPGYKYTAEHSVFVAKSARRRGVGRTLMLRLIELAREKELHVLIGAIDSTNLPSIALHESLGFECCGTLREVGYKHGGWLDAVFYQLILETPSEPIEGSFD
jgi:phosphinothricin acetyltransferase